MPEASARPLRLSDVFPLHMADVTYPEGHPLAGTVGPVNAFAIRLPDGIVLVDTGIGSGNDWIDLHYQPRARAIGDALKSANLDPAAVRMLINTHMHFDHTGQETLRSRHPDHRSAGRVGYRLGRGPHRHRVAGLRGRALRARER